MSEDSPGGSDDEAVADRVHQMMRWTPQGRALGLELVSVADGKVRARAHYRQDLVGDPDTGVLAGGVITTFLDQLCGMATVLAMKKPATVATIDLRIDYMRAATPGRDVLAEAWCRKIGRNVAFIHAVAFEDNPDNPIAYAVATFMLNAPSARGKKK
jgi:uncharacterized protein (TIGR00369 family)